MELQAAIIHFVNEKALSGRPAYLLSLESVNERVKEM